jgi:hypothetical protein
LPEFGESHSFSLEKFQLFPKETDVLDLSSFHELPLRGGFLLVEVQLTGRPLLDPLNRAASAQTIIRGNRIHVLLRADLDEREMSIALYHEVLEAATLAAKSPPRTVYELNEAGFEDAAQAAFIRFGIASSRSLNEMLANFGF